MTPLRVLHLDDDIVVVAKPAGVLVHRSALDRHAPRILLQELRDTIQRRVYPVHRLDRPTSGAMVFALSPEAAAKLSEQFTEHRVDKRYLAVVRGYAPVAARLDWPLREEDGLRPKAENPAMPACTEIARLAEIELPVAIDRYPSSRYSLIEANPSSGRRHQIRRHLSQAGHPLIGDAKHGKGVHNRYFKTHYFAEFPGSARLLLAATRLGFAHPFSGARIEVEAALESDFAALLERFGWQAHLSRDRITVYEQTNP
ncbi:pseudouridine synthase [Halotalea alkalilenta]|uniref:tRNA pseudouridine synthase C n=1 Tax=Halotalea alkalilenta TaxID=376489 RepID=A0A172YKR8_9GAMM|nr:pseudouridine synthase [Halotalea alkalilenta]ANF59752.1 pseudouridylate synthase [Halotalea alkalilenta]